MNNKVYAFGGMQNSIEFYDGSKWTALDLHFPNITTSISVYPVSDNSVLVFGCYKEIQDTVWLVNLKNEMMEA
jgi:hypothetical protein